MKRQMNEDVDESNLISNGHNNIQSIHYDPIITPPASPVVSTKNGKASNDKPESDVPSPGWWTSVRFRIALLFMGAMMINSSMRFNLSVSMVCMVNSTAFTSNDFTNSSHNEESNSSCSRENFDDVANNYGGTFAWDSERQGLIFSAIWWGGIITTFPGGFIADRYGPKNTMSWVALLAIVATALIPTMAQLGYQYLIIVRILTGFGQGMVVPVIASAISRWIPPAERGLALAITTTGNQIPSVLGNPFYAWLCTQKDVLGGWPMIFYFSSFVTLGWLILWAIYMTNRPEKHRGVSEKELRYIQYTLRNDNVSGKRKVIKVPWLKMAKSSAIWAIMCMNFAAAFTNFTFAAYVPTYFKEVLRFDIQKNGLLSALPFIAQFSSKYLWTFIASETIKRTNISQTTSCAIFNSIACFGQSAFLIILSFLDCSNSGLAVAILCCASVMTGGIVPGFLVAALSVAPIFSGTVRSSGTTMSQIGGIVSPYLVGGITKNGTRLEWQMVFVGTAVILSSANVIWLCFGTAEIQPWAMVTSDDDSKPIENDNNIKSKVQKVDHFDNPVSEQSYASHIVVEKY